MSTTNSVLVEIDGPIGLLTLNRAERHNAFDDGLIADIIAGLRELNTHPDVRVVVVSALGKSFCAGADLNWMKRAAGYTDEENLADSRQLAEMLRTLNEMKKPTIARVQGPAYGGGVGLISACDIAVATYDAQFSLSEVKLGIIPAVISPYVIAKIGERYARRYFLTAERFSASEAYRIGLVHEIVPDEAGLDDAVGELIDTLLKNGPRAMAQAKLLIRAVVNRPIDAALIEDTAQRITRQRASDEGREGLGAFLEKRKPNWLTD
jgi:methylglutaconyl-CoA hydratase